MSKRRELIIKSKNMWLLSCAYTGVVRKHRRTAGRPGRLSAPACPAQSPVTEGGGRTREPQSTAVRKGTRSQGWHGLKTRARAHAGTRRQSSFKKYWHSRPPARSPAAAAAAAAAAANGGQVLQAVRGRPSLCEHASAVLTLPLLVRPRLRVSLSHSESESLSPPAQAPGRPGPGDSEVHPRPADEIGITAPQRAAAPSSCMTVQVGAGIINIAGLGIRVISTSDDHPSQRRPGAAGSHRDGSSQAGAGHHHLHYRLGITDDQYAAARVGPGHRRGPGRRSRPCRGRLSGSRPAPARCPWSHRWGPGNRRDDGVSGQVVREALGRCSRAEKIRLRRPRNCWLQPLLFQAKIPAIPRSRL